MGATSKIIRYGAVKINNLINIVLDIIGIKVN